MTSRSITLLHSRRLRCLAPIFAWAAIAIGLLPIAANAQSAGTGTITGRVLNAGTGDYLRNAVVSIVGTDVSTIAEAGGNYRLFKVPAGEVRLKVEFAGLDPVEESVSVTAGQSVTHNFSLTSKEYDKDTVMLDKFVVAGEREGNAKALQEQRNAVNMKTMIASDAFGDVSEGNVGEFMKRMPGVAIDYTEADARSIRIRGMDPKYAVVLMDGAPVASAGSSDIATGRAFELEQLSIASIESVELTKTPTPDQAASAVAGVVNLRSKSALDSKGRRINIQASAALNGYDMLRKTPGPDDGSARKIQPNFSVSYADVLVTGKLGISAGVNYSRTFAEQKAETVTYRWDSDSSNNLTEVPIVTGFSFRDSPKVSTRINYNTRLDFKLSPNAWFYTKVDYNSYEARFYSRDITVNLATATAGQGTINAIATNTTAVTTPTNPNIEYSYNSQTSQAPTSATTGIANTSINQGGGGTNKHGATLTLTSFGEVSYGALRTDAQLQFSRATNWYSDLPYGFFFASGTTGLAGQQIRFDRNGPSDMAVKFTQLAGSADWRDLNSYRLGGLTSNDRGSDVETYSAHLNFRFPFSGVIPFDLKWGVAVDETARNVNRRISKAYTFIGPDHLPNTADDNAVQFAEPSFRMKFDTGGTADSNLTNVDRFALARALADHPDWFTQPFAEQLAQLQKQNHWNISEQVNAGYLQATFKVQKLRIAPGFRYEFTRTRGKGPIDNGNVYALRAVGLIPATGPRPNPLPATPTITSPLFSDYVNARYGRNDASGTTYGDIYKYLHTTYQITPDLLVRASYHDSITRPDPANMFFGFTITNDTATPPTANINNPELKPEYGRSVNLDLEYYFGKGASLIFGAFRTDIRDLQRRQPKNVDADGNVEDTELVIPELAGYLVNVWNNVDKSHNSGFEFSYSQPLTFLPGVLSGFSVFCNHTHLIYDNLDNYLRSPKDISNAGISYQYKRYNARFSVNRTGHKKTTTAPANGAANAGVATYIRERTMFDVSVGYDITKNLSLFANGRNITNEPETQYQLGSQIIIRNAQFGALWTAGIKGRF